MAASSSASSKVSLKLLIDTKTKKVLFAEANKEFVDFLFHILSLPVGTVIRLLTKNSMVGSLGKLYDSIENLSDTYMQPNQSKDSVLNPKTVNYGANVPFLLTTANDTMTLRIYRCPSHPNYVSDDTTAQCPSCRSTINSQLTYVRGTGAVTGTGVKPMSTISSITMLNKFNVKEVGGLQEKVVSLEMKEGLMLLKASLQSKNVLTSVFLA
ncbi:hypothetical protein L2E82_32310 [Cichorium intybus]|uniref:Uncharacterized protein n=1 Tax=Cichorium intybus TaxID=13427 RepID=A0ACB9BGV6_CICIN|nr:hypothetical protein L2E82_32310 [Cichorium intybus]